MFLYYFDWFHCLAVNVVRIYVEGLILTGVITQNVDGLLLLFIFMKVWNNACIIGRVYTDIYVDFCKVLQWIGLTNALSDTHYNINIYYIFLTNET